MLKEALKQVAVAFVAASPEERRALWEPERIAGALAVFGQHGANFAYAHGDETIRVARVSLTPEEEAAVRGVGWTNNSGEWRLE
jgi:hypothetical protein